MMAGAKKQQGFEASLGRLEEIVQSLEDDDLTLEQSLKLFEEGVALAEACGKRLDEAEQKVVLLARGDGGPRQTPLEPGEAAEE